MIISRSADYVLRATVQLARESGPRFVPLHELASATQAPPFLLARLMQRVAKAGLVQSMKGHGGGFRLPGDPAAITAADIIRCIDGPFVLLEPGGPSLPEDPQPPLGGLYVQAEAALRAALAIPIAELAGLWTRFDSTPKQRLSGD